ncbi:hypothetical protein CEP51_002521 [Fusarium floridanum]|uniref:BTB domain-containing protein n=1 Tax=Fusarium floridanum TaxID=1325733 RepID=A0A428SB01_9HYPO|nr:hypothetical protein CEP51_002521 [Fusarium floridanum]
MASNKSSGSRGYISSDIDLEKDTRPEHSPYASEACTVLFQDGNSHHIPRDFLEQVKKLHLYVIRGSPRLKVHFSDVTSATGHVLLHFLVCGIYQCVKPQGDSLEDRHVSEFKTALDVYAAADSLQIPRLRDLARREITRVGDTLSLPSVISAIEDSNLSFKTLPGVVAYVESRILSFGEDATPAAINSMLSELEGPNTLSRTLLKSMVLLKSSELFKQQLKLHENEDRVFSGAAASVLDNKMRRRMSPTEQAMKDAEAKAEIIPKKQKRIPLVAYPLEEAYSTEDAPAEEIPADEVPAEEAPTEEEVPAEEEAPTEEETPADEVPAEEAPEEEAPAEEEASAEEEPVCQEQARLDLQEIHALLEKKARRRGKMLKKDAMRLNFLLERSRLDPARVKAAEVPLLRGVTAAPLVALPAVDDVPQSSHAEAWYAEATSADRPGSTSSETWSFAGTPDSHSTQTSPKPEASEVQAEGNYQDFWDSLLERRATPEAPRE